MATSTRPSKYASWSYTTGCQQPRLEATASQAFFIRPNQMWRLRWRHVNCQSHLLRMLQPAEQTDLQKSSDDPSGRTRRGRFAWAKRTACHPTTHKGIHPPIQSRDKSSKGRRSSQQEAARDKLKNLNAKIDNIVDAIAAGNTSNALTERLEKLEREKEHVLSNLKGTKPDPVRIHPNAADLYIAKVGNLRQALKSQRGRPNAPLS